MRDKSQTSHLCLSGRQAKSQIDKFWLVEPPGLKVEAPSLFEQIPVHPQSKARGFPRRGLNFGVWMIIWNLAFVCLPVMQGIFNLTCLYAQETSTESNTTNTSIDNNEVSDLVQEVIKESTNKDIDTTAKSPSTDSASSKEIAKEPISASITKEEAANVTNSNVVEEVSENKSGPAPAKSVMTESIIVNGDVVEYSTDSKYVTVTDNVVVEYKGTKLTCQKLTVNTVTKEGRAEGNVRLEDAKGVIEGEKISYNFQAKSGTIIDSKFRSSPYFGRAEKIKKVSDAEFIAQRGYFSTCSYDNPHYRIKTRKMDLFPGDKIQTKDDTLYVGRIPLFCLPQYNHSLKDPLMHVQLMPGKSKDWGPYLLTAWRYNLTEDVKGRIYLDYRDKMGVAEGFGVNYTTTNFGRGDYKYYYTQERDQDLKKTNEKDNLGPWVFQRYFIRWRHKWDIDEQTNLTSEYYKIVDSRMAIYGSENNFLKDYFFREYEKDSQPPSYTLLHRAFKYSSLDFLMQKRTNRWYANGYLEKLPEIKYNLSSYQIGESPFYFANNSSAGNYNKKNTSTMTPATNALTPDVHVNRFDTTNRFSLPMKVAFVQLTPFVSGRQTFYDKDINGGSVSPRTIFSTGADASTKFYRIFNVNTNFLGLDINGLRHIITPSIAYSYNHTPTIKGSNFRQIDDVDSITNPSNAAVFELTNKLQTKRDSKSVDLVNLKASTTYSFYSINNTVNEKSGSDFSDFLIKMELLPYSWLRVNSDATYKSSQDYFSNVNYDVNFSLGAERSFGFGQRYQLKGGNEVIFNFRWRLNPKWAFAVYHRRERGHDPALKRGLREQEYTISRDLHCWTWDITYNVRRGHGEEIWFVFRLKAFPELGFDFNQGYHAPKPGSQSNP